MRTRKKRKRTAKRIFNNKEQVGERVKPFADFCLKKFLFGNNLRMIKTVRDISTVKKEIFGFKGEDVNVKVNLGRNKFVTYKGKITNVYPALFTVSPYGDFSGKTNFSYNEVMCGQVTVKRA